MKNTKIGFVGQGYVGKNYADDFENRGYFVVRYSLEEPYVKNKNLIQDCDVVFIAVPTPTTPEGFDASIVRGAVDLVGKGKTAVIKSTILPGTTESLQDEHPDKTILFSPEFLLEATAAHDAAYPILNILGIPGDSAVYREKAEFVLSLLPASPHSQITLAREAELFKYAHNIHGVFRILFTNFLYDLSQAYGCRWEEIDAAMKADPYFSTEANYYNRPVHKTGRGAGGNCFIKDFAAFAEMYEKIVGDEVGTKALKALEEKNIDLLRSTKKDLDLLRGVYGEEKID